MLELLSLLVLPLMLLSPVILIVALLFAVSHFRRNVRRNHGEAAAFAASRGWILTESVPALCTRWRAWPLGSGHSRAATSVLTGESGGHQFVSFNYRYTTGTGDDRKTSTFHVMAMSLPVPMPPLSLSADSSFARLIGGQDVQFESGDFNNVWRVTADSDRYAYDVIHPRMMLRLLQPDAVTRRLIIEGSDLLLVRSGHRQMSDVDAGIRLLSDFYDLIPDHVWKTLGYDPHDAAVAAPLDGRDEQ